jgi:DHA1 family bicyclomycin/chloramphenicol resistance-like MFS transporter
MLPDHDTPLPQSAATLRDDAHRAGPAFLLALLAAAALGPMAMQVIMPALPAIQADFDAPISLTQGIVSVSMISIGVATLLYGPLADKFGRRPALIAGTWLYLLGSLACALAPTLGTVIAARVLQAIGGAAGITIARTMVHDVFGRERAARMMAYLTIIIVMIPTLSPALGGGITEAFGWRAVFWLLVGISAVSVIVVHRRMPETAAPSRDDGNRPSLRATMKVMAGLMVRPSFLGYALQSAFALTILFVLTSYAPYLMRPGVYGLFVMAPALGFMIGLLAAAGTSRWIGLDSLIILGSLVAVAGAGATLVEVRSADWALVWLLIPVTVSTLGIGLALPGAQSAALAAAPEATGAASGLIGFLQLLLAGIVVQTAGALNDGTALPMARLMLAGAVASLLLYLLMRVMSARGGGAGARPDQPDSNR